MLECKDCCLYDTEACRYGRYALEHNMSLNCDGFIVEHNKAYQQGRADGIMQGRADAIEEVRCKMISIHTDKISIYGIDTIEARCDAFGELKEWIEKQIKEQKE